MLLLISSTRLLVARLRSHSTALIVRPQVYHRGPNYFEVDIDIGSNRAARNVVGLVAGTTKTVVVDMGILMEGHVEDELPERLLGTVQLYRIDMDKAKRVTQSQLDALIAMGRKDK